MSLSAAYSSSYRTPSFLARRRIATYFTGGTNGVLTLVSALQQRGFAVHDMSVDIRDGVPESSMVCTVMVTNDDITLLLDHLRDLSTVVSAELV